MRCPVVALVIASTVLALAPPTRAEAPDPADRVDEAVCADFARAFDIDPSDVVSLRAFDLPRARGQTAVLVGRFHERRGDRRWTFPGLVVYARCDFGPCLAHAYLGAAAKHVAPMALVDLDAGATELPTQLPSWNTRSIDGPERPRWPALVLAIERQPEVQAATDVVVVSLRHPERPTVVFTSTLSERWPDASAEEMRDHPRPAGAIVGRELTGLRLEHAAKAHRITLTVQPIDSRWSPCLRSKPYPVIYDLEASDPPHFREVPPASPPPLPCH
ncbi:MAG: hypothetical protein U1F43_12925 [Myxococcota bacterium]